jgi:3-phosphoshikimate 1-carboxyvinyltransferase
MSDSIEIPVISGPVQGSICPPGSKSLTNRALIIAALAEGKSCLSGVLDSQDTQVMMESLKRLNFPLSFSEEDSKIEITGYGGAINSQQADLELENSGTSIRFLTALCALGEGEYSLDGNQRMRERPIAPLVETLNQLGTNVLSQNNNGYPPLTVQGSGLSGGKATVAGNISSQYLSALLMVSPCAKDKITLELSSELVSQPYIDMTLSVMGSFGVHVDTLTENQFQITPQKYKAVDYTIEPDASAASYFYALAAITGEEVTVENLTRKSLQGDVLFVDALEEMGCEVIENKNSITVKGKPLKGIDIDMNAISDTAQTLAVVAAYADGPTRIHNIAHVRHKETDRINAVATELKRAGLNVDEFDDGMTIHPGTIQPASIKTYDDHRMAMSFALLGLKSPGIIIEDPGCTSKTYPHYFDDLFRLCGIN